MQLKNIRMKDAHNAIEDRLDFGVRASKHVRETLGIKHSLRGYSPKATLGYHNPEKIDGFALPKEYFDQMCDHMERAHVAYIIESYYTVIAWVDGSGGVHMPPFRHSLATTQHQHTASYALKGKSFFWVDTERSPLSYEGTIGRPGW